MHRIPLTASLGSLLFATLSNAQTVDQSVSTAQEQITEVIVTGTRVPRAVDKIPGAITVIGEQELAQTRAVTMDATAVLSRTVPGYSESSQAMSNTGENLRGRIALRLFDGVPQGSPLREGTRNGTFTDMGIIGWSLPDMTGGEVLSALKRRHLPTRIVIYTGEPGKDVLRQSVRLGAWGFISKSDEPSVLVDTIAAVARGRMRAATLAGLGGATNAVERSRAALRVHLVWVPVALVGVPALVYLAAYIPFFAAGNTFGQFLEQQWQIYRYHAGLDATHRYQSAWWQWPGRRTRWM